MCGISRLCVVERLWGSNILGSYGVMVYGGSGR